MEKKQYLYYGSCNTSSISSALKAIATIVTEHTQLSDSSSLFSLTALLSLRVCYKRFGSRAKLKTMYQGNIP